MAGPRIGVATHPTDKTLSVVTISGLPKMPGWTFHVTMRPSSPHQPARVNAFEALAPEGETVTPEQFRRIPVGQVIRLAGKSVNTPMVAFIAATLDISPGPRPYGGDGVEHYRAVASVYRFALSQETSPSGLVAEVYGVHVKTASRWIAFARSNPDPKTRKPYLGDYRAELAAHGFAPARKAMKGRIEHEAAAKAKPRARKRK